MSEVSLYRKFRPQTFSHLVGQDHVRVTLMNAIKSGRLVHAYLFTGPRGTGKTSTARLFAKAINCINLGDDGEPCEECDICRDITIGRLIDVVEIDAASHTGVDDVRELIDKLHFAPTRARNKVYIVDEVHMLSKGAFNAFLKTLEEPPESVYFILATTEAHKVPETIISRCHRFDFKRIDEKTVMARLGYIAQTEGIRADDEALEIIARHVDGGLRDAIGLLEQLTVEGSLTTGHVREVLGVAGSSAIEKFYGFLVERDTASALAFLQELYREGMDFVQFTKDLLEKMRREMLKAVETEDMPLIGERVAMIEIFQKAFDQLRGSLIVQLPLEMAVIKYLSFEEEDAGNAHADAVRAEARAETMAPNIAKVIPKAETGSSDATLHAPNPAAVPPVAHLTPAELKKQWPRVIERIKTPKLRISLKDVRSYDVAGHVITLGFTAKFHQDTVMDGVLRSELEALIESVVGRAVKVESRLERVELHSAIEHNEGDGEFGATGDADDAIAGAAAHGGERRAAGTYDDGDDPADAVAAMFGGEVVE